MILKALHWVASFGPVYDMIQTAFGIQLIGVLAEAVGNGGVVHSYNLRDNGRQIRGASS